METRKSIRRLLFSFLLLFSWRLQGRINNNGLPFITSYALTEYNAAMQNWCVLQDRRGIMYFGNNMGVLEFDGVSWQLYPVKNKSWVRSLAQDAQGRIYVGANAEFGYLRPDAFGKLQYISLLDKVPLRHRDFNDVWRTFITEDGVIFQTFDSLFLYKDDRISVLTRAGSFFFGYMANGRYYVKEAGKGILTLSNGQLQPIPGSEQFSDDNFFAALPYENETVLLAFRNRGLYLYHAGRTGGPAFEKLSGSQRLDEFLSQYQVYCGAALGDGLFALGTIQNGLLIVNKKGEILQHLNRNTGLTDNGVYFILCDWEKNMWLGLANGIAYVESSSPFALLDHRLGVSGNGFGAYLEKEKGADAETGLFLATGENLYRRGSRKLNATFRPIPGAANQNWSLQKFRGALLCAWREGIRQIDSKSGTSKQVLSENRNFFKFMPLRNDTDNLLAGAWNGLVLLHFQAGNWLYRWPIEGFSLYCRSMEQDGQGNIWICLENKGVYRMRLSGDMRRVENVRQYGAQQGLPSDFGNRVFHLGDEIVFGTEKGLFHYDGNRDRFYADGKLNSFFNKDAPLFPFVEDAAGDIWFQEGMEKGVLHRQGKDSYRLEKTPFYRIKREKVEVAILPLDERNVLFGIADGFIHYDPGIRRVGSTPFLALIRRVECSKDNGALFLGTFAGGPKGMALAHPDEHVPVLPFARNAVRFVFAAAFYESRQDNEYSCQLQGFDEQWSNWSPKPEKEYTNLPEGEYRFTVKARNVYWQISKAAYYRFVILPPWYLTWPAYLGYLLLAAGFVSSVVKLYTLRLKREKVRLQRMVEQKTQELKDASLTDPLTGLRNRRYMSEILTTDISAFIKLKKYIVAAKERRNTIKQENVVFGVFLFDIDHFKSVNDSHGHEVGDLLLKQFAQTLRSSVREDDPVLRIGGEEFLIILKKTQMEYLEVFAKKILDRVRGMNLVLPEDVTLQRTCSIGYAAFPFYDEQPDLLSFEQTVMLTDLALYHAKSHGRNQAVQAVHGEECPEDAAVAKKMVTMLEYALQKKFLSLRTTG